MCGISGIWLRAAGSSPGEALESSRRMADAMVHRGPDGSGAFADPDLPLAISHRRLSIIDTSNAGLQPMLSGCGRYAISFNGEIYNYRAIRAELDIRGRSFKSASDTEVMLEAMAEWGVEAAVNKFIGMFAFALWDIKDKQLWLVRDRLGIKPLYFGMAGGAFVFGSELRAVRALEQFSPELDDDAVSLYMRFGYIPAPRCVYRGLRMLEPGSILRVDAAVIDKGAFSPSRYWSPLEAVRRGKENPFRGSDEEAAEALEALLMDAVGLRMIADVPLGAFLSGGLDSSLVVALMQAQSAAKIRTYTIGFREEKRDEAPFAAKIAAHLGTDHTEHYFTPREAMDAVPLMPAIYDEPFADSSQLPTRLVSAITRRGETVSLSGDGGDELFCGYKNFSIFADEWSRMEKIPEPLRRAAGALLGAPGEGFYNAALSPFSSGRGAAGAAVMRRAAGLSSDSFAKFYCERYSLWRDPEMFLLNPTDPMVSALDPALKPPLDSPRELMMYFHLCQYLTDDILTKLDRASMSVSLEARVPLLDHRVVEFAWRLPLSMKYRDGKGKWLLRNVLYKHVPQSLVDRPKMGFAAPINEWLRGDLRPWAEELLSDKALRDGAVFRAPAVRKIWSEHASGKADHAGRLWRILMFQSWRKEWRV